MKTINKFRNFIRIDAEPLGDYVLYWMQSNRRLQYNFALEYAVEWANRLQKPLVILEGLACNYPWASARTSTFILEGMAEHTRELRDSRTVTYFPYPEKESGSYLELVRKLCSRAAILISDEYPVSDIRDRNDQLENELSIPFHTVDSNGIIPMALSAKTPYSAYIFRQSMQKKFLECWSSPPRPQPLELLGVFGELTFEDDITAKRNEGISQLASRESISAFVAGLSGRDSAFRSSIRPVDMEGTRKAGLKRLGAFAGSGLLSYDKLRNNPDSDSTSRLSSWLHFGKISVFEVVDAIFGRQPEGWDIADSRPVRGQRYGFFRGYSAIEDFLDEVITWRETGFHFAHHEHDYDQFTSLPGWALETLAAHADDPRQWNYSYDQLAASQTHDEVWNAAQTQLREEGRIHNYLRMLWGKKVLEWTPDPQTALTYLIDLNNYYAIDGRDPNSYSGIFWIFGRFDRAWGPERPIYGKIRYMTSESARKKVKMAKYLKKYSAEQS